jgi:Kef-type K+ transport system membrane component KefB
MFVELILRDQAIVLITAVMIIYIFYKLKNPIVLGYIFAEGNIIHSKSGINYKT